MARSAAPLSAVRAHPLVLRASPRRVATAFCALLLASSPLTAAAQPEVTPPLTIDSLLNAAYLTPPFGDTPDSSNRLVQLTDGNYLPDPTVDGDHLIVSLLDNPPISATGDLNGDGVQDIVAVFNQSPGGPVANPVWVVEAYLNQDGQPVPVAGIAAGGDNTAGGRFIVITSLSIQSALITVTGRRMGDHDAVCCPSQPFTQVLSLQDDQLVDVSATTAAPGPASAVAGSVPANTADISSVRSAMPGGQSGFTGQVLMPPPGLPPFASLQLFSAVPGLGRDSLSTDVSYAYPHSYTLWFVDAVEQSQQQFGVASAEIGGATSRQMYDDSGAEFVGTFTGCAPTAAYCARPNFPACTRLGCMMQAEVFHGLKVKGADALVVHWWKDRAVGWDVSWFDAQAGVSYRMTTENGADPGDFDTGLSATNQAGAQQLVAVAEKLVVWAGT